MHSQVQRVVRSYGGVPLSLLAGAPPLEQVVDALAALAHGKLLLGHGLAKDLAALGWLAHPHNARFDTMSHAAFCNAAGNARSLRVLARHFLGRDIQGGGGGGDGTSGHGRGGGRQQRQRKAKGQHDPEEDAAAVMELYEQVRVCVVCCTGSVVLQWQCLRSLMRVWLAPAAGAAAGGAAVDVRGPGGSRDGAAAGRNGLVAASTAAAAAAGRGLSQWRCLVLVLVEPLHTASWRVPVDSPCKQ